MNKHNSDPQQGAGPERTSPAIIVRPYCNTELADMYGVCRRTFASWLLPFQAELGERIGRYYSSLQVQLIFERLGTPYQVWEE